MRLTLKQKLSIGICAITFITIAVVMALGQVFITAAIEQRIRKDMLTASGVFEYFQQVRFNELLAANQMAAQIPYLRAVVTTPGIDQATILDTLQEARGVLHNDLFMVTDADGRLLASATQPERSGDDLSGEPAFRKALDGENFTGVWTSPQGTYQVAASPFSFDGEVAGVLLSGDAVDRKVVDQIEKMINCETALITPYQSLLSSSANPLLGNLTAGTEAFPAAAGQILTKQFGKEKYLLLNIPLTEDGKNGGYILARSLTGELAFFNRLKIVLLLAGCFILAMAVLAGIFYSGRITRPIEILLNGIRRLTAGDMTSRVTVSTGGDEIGQLAKEFNAMAENLYQTTVSKDFVDSIIANMNNSLIILTPGLKIKMVNETTCALLGYPKEELFGRPLDMLLNSFSSNTPGSFRLEGLGEQESVRNAELMYRAKDGREIPVLFSAAPLKDNAGKITGIVCVAQDITERKKAELAQKRLATAMTSAGEAIMITDEHGNIQYVNPAYELITGYPSGEAIGQNPRLLKSGRQDAAFYKAMWGCLTRGEQWTGNFVNRRKDGALFDAETTIASVKDASGKIINFVAVIRDVTPRKEMEKKLLETNRNLVDRENALRSMLKELNETHDTLVQTQMQLMQSEKMASVGQLAAGVAHEINNPVGFISNNMTILVQYIADYTKVLRMADRLRESVAQEDLVKAKSIVEEMNKLKEEISLDYVIGDMDKLLQHNLDGLERVRKIVLDLRTFARENKSETEQMKIEEVIEGILAIIHSEIKYKVKLEKNYGDTPPIKCNPQRLGQVFINLLMNALQAIEGTGIIEIKTYARGESVCADVRDTGKGIEPQNLSKIFDPFFTTKPVGQGTGLGLSISYEIVKKYGGEITVQSKVGAGTTFTVIIPSTSEGKTP